jgi:hypothetical protein
VGFPVVAAPFDSSFKNTSTMKAPSEGVQKIADQVKKLTLVTNLCNGIDYSRAYRDTSNVTSSLRALRALSELVAEQPGYPVGHAKRRELRAALKPLRDKTEELCKAVDSASNLASPLYAMTPKVVAAKRGYALDITAILNDPANGALIQTVSEDVSIPEPWKQEFFQCVGFRIQAAIEALLRTGGFDAEVMDQVEKAVATGKGEAMIGACLAATAFKAIIVGNLPGPDSFYVALIRLRSLWTLAKASTSVFEISKSLHELVHDLPKALRLNGDVKVEFKRYMAEMQVERSKTTPAALKKARINAIKIIDDHCVGFHAAPVYSWALSVLNIIMLLGTLHGVQDFDKLTLQNYVDIGNGALATATGVGAAAGRTLVNLEVLQKVHLTLIKDIAEACEKAGTAVSIFAAITSIVDGAYTLSDGEKSGDPWKIRLGGLQISSGVLIGIGATFGVPGLQALGVILSTIALAVSLTSAVIEACKDPAKRVFLQLVKQLREAKCTYDGSVIVETLQVQGKVDELQKLAEGLDISLIVLDMRSGGVQGAYMEVLSSLLNLGFENTLSQEMITYQ